MRWRIRMQFRTLHIRNGTRTVTLCTRSPLVFRHVIQSFATMPTPLRGLDCRRNLSEAPRHWDEPLRIARAAKALIREHNLVTDHAMHVFYTPSSHARNGTFHPSSRQHDRTLCHVVAA